MVLSGREHERAAGEQMNVQVEDGLAAIGIRIYYNAVAVFSKASLASDLSRGYQQMSEQFAV